MPMYSPANPASQPIRQQMGTDQPSFDPNKTPSPPGVGGMNDQSFRNQQTMTGAPMPPSPNPVPPPPRVASSRSAAAAPASASPAPIHSNLNQAMYAQSRTPAAAPATTPTESPVGSQMRPATATAGANPGPAPAPSTSFDLFSPSTWLPSLGLTADPEAAKYNTWQQQNQLYNSQQQMANQFGISPQYQTNQDAFGQLAQQQAQGNNPILQQMIANQDKITQANLGNMIQGNLMKTGGGMPQANQQMINSLTQEAGAQMSSQAAQEKYADYLQGQQNMQAYQNMVLNPYVQGQQLANQTGSLNLGQTQQATNQQLQQAQQNQNLLFGLANLGISGTNLYNNLQSQGAASPTTQNQATGTTGYQLPSYTTTTGNPSQDYINSLMMQLSPISQQNNPSAQQNQLQVSSLNPNNFTAGTGVRR